MKDNKLLLFVVVLFVVAMAGLFSFRKLDIKQEVVQDQATTQQVTNNTEELGSLTNPYPNLSTETKTLISEKYPYQITLPVNVVDSFDMNENWNSFYVSSSEESSDFSYDFNFRYVDRNEKLPVYEKFFTEVYPILQGLKIGEEIELDGDNVYSDQDKVIYSRENDLGNFATYYFINNAFEGEPTYGYYYVLESEQAFLYSQYLTRYPFSDNESFKQSMLSDRKANFEQIVRSFQLTN